MDLQAPPLSQEEQVIVNIKRCNVNKVNVELLKEKNPSAHKPRTNSRISRKSCTTRQEAFTKTKTTFLQKTTPSFYFKPHKKLKRQLYRDFQQNEDPNLKKKFNKLNKDRAEKRFHNIDRKTES
jgi:hypothetical protein